MRILLKTSLALLLFVAATEAWGGTLYKLTDPDGRVTYTDAVPRGFPGAVKRIDIDTGDNVVTLHDGARADARVLPVPDYAEIIRRRPPAPDEARIDAARDRLEAARRALADAQESASPDDWIYFGPGNPLGMRRAPRPEYQERLERLEREVLIAEERLSQAERG
jgi:hypothetical protein